MSSKTETIIGIDLGTTNSLGAWLPEEEGAQPYCFTDDSGQALVPSVISFDPDADVQVGRAALKRQLDEPESTVYSIKRLIGKSPLELADYLEKLPYKTFTPPHRKLIFISIHGKGHAPEEISAMILREIRNIAESSLGRTVNGAVITVPAYFDDAQRQATRDAGRLAGLDVKRIINEPTAAALAYGLNGEKEGRIAVYDLGGGTFDVSILRINDGVFQVVSTHGDTALGGDDFDQALVDHVSQPFKEKFGIDATADARMRMKFKRAAEDCKKELSRSESVAFTVDIDGDPVSLDVSLGVFNEIIQPYIEKTIDSCRQAVSDAGMDVSDLDAVVLVGGSTRIPSVRSAVADYFGMEPSCDINPDKVVALGAAVQARILSGGYDKALLMDITPLSLGLETIGGAVSKLIMRNTSIPCEATEYFTSYVDNQTGIDLHILQGEREMAQDCRSLGKFKLKIPPLPAGMVKVKTTFRLDVNGILNVQALEERSGNEVSVEITPSHGLSRDEVDRVLYDSLEHAQEDFDAIRILAVRTELTRVITATHRGLKLAGDVADKAMLDNIQSMMREAQSMEESRDVEALEEVLQKLQDATVPLAEWLVNDAANTGLRGVIVDEA